MEQSKDEKYAEWLERMDIPIEDQTDIEAFKDYLKEEFEITNENQIDALWSQTKTSETYEEHGIRAIIVNSPWGRMLRYAVQGLGGLWGWSSVQLIGQIEEWL